MGVTVKTVGETIIVRLHGELDVHSATPFREAVDETMRRNPCVKHLVIMMEEVTFLDSVGIGAILGRYRIIEGLGGKMGLVGVQPPIERLFQMAGILKIIPVYASEGQALASM